MSGNDPVTEQLLDQAAAGSKSAVDQLLTRYRQRLRKMVAVRLDDRLSARLDPSDVIQEALTEAARHLPDYLERRPVAFYPWLRAIALDRVLDMRRRHVHAGKRSVCREEQGHGLLSGRSSVVLADRLFASVVSPSNVQQRRELQDRVRAALDELEDKEREILILRYLEELPTDEIAELLEISERTVRRGHRRALARLTELLHDVLEE